MHAGYMHGCRPGCTYGCRPGHLRLQAGDTALDWAIRENHMEIVEMLELAAEQRPQKMRDAIYICVCV